MTGYSSRQSPWRIRMMKNKKVLFLDMDGTTLDDEKQLSGENLEALRRAAREGSKKAENFKILFGEYMGKAEVIDGLFYSDTR